MLMTPVRACSPLRRPVPTVSVCARGTTPGPGFVTGDQWKIARCGLTLG
jgi:hypothetical protein